LRSKPTARGKKLGGSEVIPPPSLRPPPPDSEGTLKGEGNGADNGLYGIEDQKSDHPVASLLRPGTRGRDVADLEFAVVAFFVDAADMLGLPRSVAAIYGICFASSEPLCFADILGRLNLSQGSISQGLRILREVGGLKVSVNARATTSNRPFLELKRRDYYEPDLGLRKLIAHFLQRRVAPQLSAGEERLRVIHRLMELHDDSILCARVQALQSWHDKTRALLPLARSFLKIT
jgi:HTH-type transcriptional regulator, glycine betaine synthesis regulator